MLTYCDAHPPPNSIALTSHLLVCQFAFQHVTSLLELHIVLGLKLNLCLQPLHLLLKLLLPLFLVTLLGILPEKQRQQERFEGKERMPTGAVEALVTSELKNCSLIKYT